MTVAELIAELSKLDANLEVQKEYFFEDGTTCGGGCCGGEYVQEEISEVRELEITVRTMNKNTRKFNYFTRKIVAIS